LQLFSLNTETKIGFYTLISYFCNQNFMLCYTSVLRNIDWKKWGQLAPVSPIKDNLRLNHWKALWYNQKRCDLDGYGDDLESMLNCTRSWLTLFKPSSHFQVSLRIKKKDWIHEGRWWQLAFSRCAETIANDCLVI